MPARPAINPGDVWGGALNAHLDVALDQATGNLKTAAVQAALGGSSPVAPEDYGAVGDGIADDTTALINAIASGKNLRGKLGKTYLHRRALVMSTAGQIFDLNGATLKRAAQVVTTTATAITAGVTASITLASVAGLVVGDQIVIEQGGTYDVSARTILTIVGNVVTISGTFGQTFAGATNVRTSFNEISATASDVRITNGTLDGNSANWSWGRWNHNITVNCNGTALRALVDHCRIINQYGDGFSPAAAGWTFAYNDVENMKGRAVVFSGNTGQTSDLDTRVVFNRIINCNLDTAVGGADGLGSINFSQGGPCTVIHGNFLDGGVTGIGAIHSFNSGELTMTDNEFWNFSSWGIDGAGGGAQTASGVIAMGNRLNGCGISVDNTGNTSTSVRWKIIANTIMGGQIKLALTDKFAVQNNHISGDAIGAPASSSTTVVVGGGTFAAGTVYYRVTATNSAGESTGSTEVSAVVALNGSVIVNWKIVPGAAGYKIYRTTVSGTYTTPALLTTITGGTTYQFTDTGAAVGAGALPATDTTMLTTLTLLDMGATGGAVTNGLVSGNQFYGGQNGIRINQNVSTVRISTNMVIGQYTNGITFSTSTAITSIDVEFNTVIGTVASASGSYVGINVLASPTIFRNRVDWTAVVAGTGAMVVGGTATDVVIEHNTLLGGGHSTVLAVQAGAARTIVRCNFIKGSNSATALSDSGTNTQKTRNRFTTGNFKGRATLVGGTVTVATIEVQAGDRVLLGVAVGGGTRGFIEQGTIVAGTSFVINCVDSAGALVASTSQIDWEIDH